MPKMSKKLSQQLSTSQSDYTMVEVCDICGDIGRAAAIIICPKCRTSREHDYCRKINPDKGADDWLCDECDEKRTCSSKDLDKDVDEKLTPSSSGYKHDKPAHSALADRIGKMAMKGKVKGITPREVIMLSSSSKRFNVPVKTMKLIDESSTKIAEPTCSRPLPCKRQINSVDQRQGSRILQVPKVTKSVQANRRQVIQMAGRIANVESARNQVAGLVKETNGVREDMSAPVPGNQFLQPVNSGHEVNGDPFPLITDTGKCKPSDAELKDKRYSHVPARLSSWKGRFEIQGENFNYNSSEFVALPRARSFRWVFECSQRMPATLQFNLTPRKDIWRVFFPDDCPGEGDIGLYFHSGENKRASGDDFLMKFIEDQDFVMRCAIGEVELYLFTSKLLPAGYQRLNNEYFFWGVFRKIKKHIQ